MHLHRVGYLMIVLLAASVLHGGRCAPEGEAPTDDQSQSPGVSAFVSATISEASKIGSEVTTATEETLKAAGRYSMAAIRLLVKLLGGASQTTAAAGTILSSGVKQVNKLTGSVPVLGTVTTGVQNLVEGTTDTFKENSDFNTARRNQMLGTLQSQLDNFHPGTAGGAAEAVPTA